MMESQRKESTAKAAKVSSKVNIKLDKPDVTGVQGVHGIVFEIGAGGGC
jgi:hypothetical protein